jgi:hypothetical protein
MTKDNKPDNKQANPPIKQLDKEGQEAVKRIIEEAQLRSNNSETTKPLIQQPTLRSNSSHSNS